MKKQSVSLVFFFALILSLLFSANPGMTQTAETENFADVYQLRFHPPTTFIYFYEQGWETRFTTERQGESFENRSINIVQFHFEVETIDSVGRVNAVVVLDSIYRELIPQRQRRGNFDRQDLIGKRVRVIFEPNGSVAEVTEIDSLPERSSRQGRMFGDPKDRFKNLFWKLVDKSIAIGDEWTEHKIDTTTSEGYSGAIITHSTNHYHVMGIEKVDEFDCLKLKLTTEYSRAGSREFPERNMTITSENEGETTTVTWFAFKNGLFLKSEGDSFDEGTTAYSGASSRVMPSSTESKSYLKLLKIESVR